MSSPADFPPERQRYAEFRFCPRCGHAFGPRDFRAAECLYMCTACGFDFYQNPAPAAVVAIPHPRQPGSLLMLRRSTPPNEGLWCVPGGFIHYGEDPRVAAAREAREEVGLEVRIGEVLRAGLVDYRYRGRQICVVEVSFVGRCSGELPAGRITSAEAAEVDFHDVRDVMADPGRLAFPEQLEVVRAYAATLGRTA